MKSRLISFLLLIILNLSIQAIEEKQTYLEIIFDASNSMNEGLESETKLDAAKRVLSNLVQKITNETPENFNVGLRIYGQNFDPYGTKEKACTDSILEVPIKGIPAEQLLQKIGAIEAKGYTPIAYSLEQAGNDFKVDKNRKNIIILISDGKESCGGDPCQVAAELKKAGIDVTIHVVGFAIDDETKKLLSCISEATGGIFVSADNAEELEQALTKTMEATQTGSITFTIIGLEKIDPDTEGKLLDAQGNIIQTIKINETNSVSAGTYRLEVETQGQTFSKDNIVIEKDKEKVVALRSTKAILNLSIYQDGVDVSKKSTVILYKAGTEDEIEALTPAKEKTFTLEPGTYDVLVNYPESKTKPDLWIKDIELKASEKINKEVNFSLGILWVHATLNQIPVNQFDIYIYKAGASTSKEAKLDRFYIQHEITVHELRKSLEEGKYDVLVKQRNASNLDPVWLSDVEVKLGEMTEKTVDFQAGILKLIANMNGVEKTDYNFDIYQAGASKVRSEELKAYLVDHDSFTNQKEFILKPGNYDILATHQKTANVNSIWKENIPLTAGQKLTETFNFTSGYIQVNTTINNQEHKFNHFNFYLYPEGSQNKEKHERPKYFHNDNYAQNYLATVIPGKYDLYIEYTASPNIPSQWISSIEVKPNETSKLNADFQTGILELNGKIEGKDRVGFYCVTYRQGVSSADSSQRRNYQVHTESAINQYKVILAPGIYEVHISHPYNEFPEQWIKNLEVKAGSTTQQTVELGKKLEQEK